MAHSPGTVAHPGQFDRQATDEGLGCIAVQSRRGCRRLWARRSGSRDYSLRSIRLPDGFQHVTARHCSARGAGVIAGVFSDGGDENADVSSCYAETCSDPLSANFAQAAERAGIAPSIAGRALNPGHADCCASNCGATWSFSDGPCHGCRGDRSFRQADKPGAVQEVKNDPRALDWIRCAGRRPL